MRRGALREFIKIGVWEKENEQAALDPPDEGAAVGEAAQTVGCLLDQRVGDPKAVRGIDLTDGLEADKGDDSLLWPRGVELGLEMKPVRQAGQSIGLGGDAQLAP